MGAAIHGAWVWLREHGESQPLGQVAEPFVVLHEEGRRKPAPEALEVNSLFRRLYHSLSRKVRGLDGEDPFLLRKELRAAAGQQPNTRGT